jgi:hypothetical protein
LDGYTLKNLSFWDNETHIPIVDDEGEIGVKKKQYTFQKRKQRIYELKGSISRIEKFSFKEFVRNVSASHCCQNFPREKTLLLRQEY